MHHLYEILNSYTFYKAHISFSDTSDSFHMESKEIRQRVCQSIHFLENCLLLALFLFLLPHQQTHAPDLMDKNTFPSYKHAVCLSHIYRHFLPLPALLLHPESVYLFLHTGNLRYHIIHMPSLFSFPAQQLSYGSAAVSFIQQKDRVQAPDY